jgi:hypothetical protein
MGYENITVDELAARWGVRPSWVRAYVRRGASDPIPHVKLGKYVRFEWGSPELEAWFDRRRIIPRRAEVEAKPKEII